MQESGAHGTDMEKVGQGESDHTERYWLGVHAGVFLGVSTSCLHFEAPWAYRSCVDYLGVEPNDQVFLSSISPF